MKKKLLLSLILCMILFACTNDKCIEQPIETNENQTNDVETNSNGNVEDTIKEETTNLAVPSINGSLKVNNTNIVDEKDNIVQLRGISTHGLAWFPDYINEDCFSNLKEMGANVIRLALYTSEYNGYCTGGDKDYLNNLVINGVNYATNNDMYVIIDWHVLSEGNPNTYINEAKEFFTNMANIFSNNNNVIYEICNEPSGGTTWDDVKKYANEVIPCIKQYDEDALIIVGTPNWSQDVDIASLSPIEGYSNIMYSLHFYAGAHKENLQNKLLTALNNNLPVFVSEYGICDASGNGNVDVDSANKWIEILDENNISYVCWNLSNKNESSAIINSSCDKTSNFTYEDLSDEGKWLFNTLQSHLEN